MKLALGLALWLAVPAQAQVAPAQVAPVRVAPAPFAPATRTLLERYVAEKKVPGAVVSIGRGDAPPQYVAVGAIADGPDAAAADAFSLWRIYSMTKPITGMAAMILVEEGKLGLDQPIGDFLPAFRNMKVLVDPEKSLESRPAKTPITVRHLLTHTAGLGYTIVTKGPLLDEYNRLGLVPAAFSAAMEPGMRATRAPTLEAFADRLATLPLIAEPGTKWSYSVSLDLLGRVIEVASGMPFDAFLRKRLFDPLGMRSTFFTVPQSEARRFATMYAYTGSTRIAADTSAASAWLSPPSFPYGGAGLVSSAHDYDRFLRMLLNEGELDGVRVMKPETVRLAMSNLLPPGADASALQGVSELAGKMGFGAGGSVYLADRPEGGSRGTYGWGGAAGTLGWVDPRNKVRGVLMVNYFPMQQFPLGTEVTRAIYADLAK